MAETENIINNCYYYGSDYHEEDSESSIILSEPIKLNKCENFERSNNFNCYDERVKSEPSNDFMPFSNYKINEDPNPQIIRKKPNQGIIFKQEIAIKYLRPPTPPAQGDIIIIEEKPLASKPAPPIILRQIPPRSETPTPLIIREAPPKMPDFVRSKVITLPRRILSPPPRKLILERLPHIPSKPQSIIIEKWLPYKQKRRVIYSKYHDSTNFEEKKEKNLIIQWEAPEISIKREIKELEVTKVNPCEYIEKYGSSLKLSSELRGILKLLNLENYLTNNVTLNDNKYELIGDVHALNLLTKELKDDLFETTSKNKMFKNSKKIVRRVKSEEKKFSNEKSLTKDEAKTLILNINNNLKRELNKSKTDKFNKFHDIDLKEFEEKFIIRF